MRTQTGTYQYRHRFRLDAVLWGCRHDVGETATCFLQSLLAFYFPRLRHRKFYNTATCISLYFIPPPSLISTMNWVFLITLTLIADVYRKSTLCVQLKHIIAGAVSLKHVVIACKCLLSVCISVYHPLQDHPVRTVDVVRRWVRLPGLGNPARLAHDRHRHRVGPRLDDLPVIRQWRKRGTRALTVMPLSKWYLVLSAQSTEHSHFTKKVKS